MKINFHVYIIINIKTVFLFLCLFVYVCRYRPNLFMKYKYMLVYMVMKLDT